MKHPFAELYALSLLSLISLLPLAQAQTTTTVETRTTVPFSYDASEEVTLNGVVSSVLTKPCPGMIVGSHLLLATASGPVDASLGRFGLLGAGAVSVAAGQQIEVTGVMKMIKDKQVFMVRTVRVGGEVYPIRNEYGFPVSPQARQRASRKTARGDAMIRKTCASVLALIFVTGCSSLGRKAAVESMVTATSGSGQSATIDAAFAAPLVATVTAGGSPAGGSPAGGVVVTFTAPATGASGTFAGGANTSTATTNASGVATSATFTANGTAAAYTVVGSVSGVSTAANFSLTNTAIRASMNYAFYLSGLEAADEGPNYYALAGSVTIDTNGNVLAGEQDYNDGVEFASPQPSGDTINGGTLAVDATTGQGILTLITNDTALGVNGIETIGVQFVNSKHALIVQYDATAASSGSMDLQTLPSTLSGGYAFTLSGVDRNYFSLVAGSVFSISDTTLQDGLVDVDDAGVVTLGNRFRGTISAPDSFGRGTITGTGIASTLNYYIVGPEAMRIIDVDPDDSGVGSAFGQGGSAGTFGNASLGSSVFAVESNSWGPSYAAAGMFTTIPNGGTYQGVADNDELGTRVWTASTISGTYSIAANGYGALTIQNGNLGDVSALGIYMADQNLNLADPNNTTSGLGGAFVADLDANLNGTGVLIPQTDTSTISFAGNYAFGGQDYNGNTNGEFDFVGQGSVTGGVLTGNGFVSDPFFFFTANPATDSQVRFAGLQTSDVENVGRYTMFAPNPLVITVPAGSPNDFQVIIYQTSGGLLFWLDEDSESLFLGPLQREGPLAGLPAARRTTARTELK